MNRTSLTLIEPLRTFFNLANLVFLSSVIFLTSPLEAVFDVLYNANTNGGIAFTGNTLGLNRATGVSGQTNPGTAGSIGAFITLDTSLQVGTYPAGTTLDYTKNSSSAVLDLPPDSTVLSAFLVWSGSYGFDSSITNNDDLSTGATTNVPVTFITPDTSVHPITPTLAKSRVNSGSNGFYVRAADVTPFVVANGAGTYTTGGVPGTVLNFADTLNCAGWTLCVVYSNTKMLTSDLTIWYGCEGASTTLSTLNTVTGFRAPNSGVLTGRLFAGTLEGDAGIQGDRFLVGLISGLTIADSVSGDNNPLNNFFASQINTLLPPFTTNANGKLLFSGNSLLDPRGTFGLVNSNASTNSNVTGARQGIDITSIDIGTLIPNGQEVFYTKGTSTGDVYTITTLGLQLQITAPVIESSKTSDVSTAEVGDVVTYTLIFSNVGEQPATGLTFTDPLPEGMTLDGSTITINGVPTPASDALLISGISLPDLIVGEFVTVVVKAKVISSKTTYENAGLVTYSFIPINSIVTPTNLSSQTNTITVSSPIIAPPFANDDTGSTNAGVILNQTTSVLNNDTGVGIVVSSFDPISALGGSVVMQSDGTYVYTPPSGLSGIDAFNYTITDTAIQADTATVTITILPLVQNQTGSVAANTVLNQTTSVLGGALGTSLTVTAETVPTALGGTAIIAADGTYVYTPPSNTSGVDSFNYTATDSSGNTAVGTVTITILPAAANDMGQTPANTPLNGSTLFTNDVGTGLTLVSYTQPTNGMVVVNQSDGTYTYTPNTGFSGQDTFTYTVKDAQGVFTTATVTIIVLPTGNQDTGSTLANTVLNQTSPVLNNDIGSGLMVITTGTFSTNQGGAVVIATDGTYNYTPPLNFSGTDIFSYTAADSFGSTTNSTAVIITVLPTGLNDTIQTFANNSVNGPSVLTNDNGTTLKITDWQHTTIPGGSITMLQDGTYTYTPPSNYSGPDSFTYTAEDILGNKITNTVSVTVLPNGSNDTGTTPANTQLIGSSVLTNDIGSGLYVANYDAASLNGGSVTMDTTTGTYLYTPPTGFSGTDTFTYTLSDSSGQQLTQTVTITVTPTTVNATGTTPENTPLNGPSVLSYGIGSDLKVLSYQHQSAEGGTVFIDPITNIYTYKPRKGFTGTDSFTYTLIDSSGNSVTGSIMITSTPIAAPSNFFGRVKQCRSLTRIEYRLEASWTASPEPGVAFYRIYNKNTVVATVNANSPLVYTKTLGSKREAQNYEVVAVTNFAESARVKISIIYGKDCKTRVDR